MPRTERRNGQRRLSAPWSADVRCLGFNARERFGEILPSTAGVDPLLLWLEGTPADTLALWELLIRSAMAQDRSVTLQRLPGRRPPWMDRFVGTMWLVSVGEDIDGLASASCQCIADPQGVIAGGLATNVGTYADVEADVETAYNGGLTDECVGDGGGEAAGDDACASGDDGSCVAGSWGWHAVGPWSFAWPAARLVAEALAALGARVVADIDASMEFAATGPSVAAVGAGRHVEHDALYLAAAC